MKSERHLTIQSQSGYHFKPDVPILKLSGQYLKKAGFCAGSRVTVKIYDKTILITLDQ